MTAVRDVPAVAGRIVIEDVSVVDVADGSVTDGVTIELHRGVVAAMSTAAPAHAPGDATVVDGRGLFACPGLFDGHTHYDAENGPLMLANGVTSVRNMWGSPWHLARERGRDATDGPSVCTTSPVIDGPADVASSTWPGALICATFEDGVRVARDLVEAGYRSLKVYGNLGREALGGVCAVASECGATVVGHCPSALTFQEAADLGMTCFEHLENIENGHLLPEYRLALRSLRARAAALGPERTGIEATKLRVDGVDLAAVGMLADRLAERGVAVCPTLQLYRAMFQNPETAFDAPNLCYVSDERLAGWHPRRDFRLAPMVPVWAELVEVARQRFDLYLEIVGLLHARGVEVIAGTDTPNPFLVPGFSLHQELGLLVSAGLTPLQALRAATVLPVLRFANRQPDIRVGAQADLLLLDGDPTTTLRPLRHPAAVVHRGRYLARAALDELLHDQRRTVG